MSLFSRLFKGDKPPEGEQPGEAGEGASADSAGAEQRADAGKGAAGKTPREGGASKSSATKTGAAAKPSAGAAAEKGGPPPLRTSAKATDSHAEEKRAESAKIAAKDTAQARSAAGADAATQGRATKTGGGQARDAASAEGTQARSAEDGRTSADAARTSAASAGAAQTRGSATQARSAANPDGGATRGASSTASHARATDAAQGARAAAAASAPSNQAGSAQPTARSATTPSGGGAKPRAKTALETSAAPRERSEAAVPPRDATERIGFPARPEGLASARRDDTERMATAPAERAEELPAAQPESSAQPVSTAASQEPAPSPREAFEASAVRSLQPLACLTLELAWSERAPAEWAARSGSALRSLRATASKLDDASLTSAMDELLAQLKKAEQAGAAIEGELGREILRAYATLCALIPSMQSPEEELARRDRALVDALLNQVEGLHHAAVHRMESAGFCASQRLLRSSAAELARETGLAPELAQRVVDTFQLFRREYATMASDLASSEELRKLSALLEELRVQQMQFEQASARFRDQDLLDRRLMRAARARSLRRIYVVLARLGEVERIGQLERVPFQAKIAELTDYLRAVTRAAA